MLRKLLNVVVLVWVQAYLMGPELMKLPLLYGHYQEHWASDATLSFADFLDLHYSNDDHEEADHEGHENLPFHHHHGTMVDLSAFKVWTSDPFPSVSFPSLMGDRSLFGTQNDAELQGHSRVLIQPPRALA